MKHTPVEIGTKQERKILTISIIVLTLFVYGGYRYYTLGNDFEDVSKELLATKTEFTLAKEQFASTTGTLQSILASHIDDKTKLGEALRAEQGKNELFDAQIKTLTGSVSTLQKLSQTDKELLQKYSKVYFLNENYVPASLLDISLSGFAYQKDKPLQIHSGVWSYLQKLLQAANSQAQGIQILSAYRSFGEQTSLKAGYKQTYGSGANRFSADQGYSEHQLGTTVDFTTPAIGTNLDKLKATTAYTWLRAHAHEYGFVLSYPEGNAYYQFEPWHWRFVGLKLAQRLRDENKNFYDLDQRVIDEYLINIFD